MELRMKRTINGFFIFICILLSAQAEKGIKFQFKQKKDDAYSYISTVEEDVYYNNYLNHHAQIINRISSRVINAAPDGEAFIYANYMTTDNSIMNRTGNHLIWGEDTTSVFARKANGEMTISDDIYMPTVRNVPVFSDKAISVGESWTFQGKEVQDVRKAFHMEKPLIFPFEATYTYKGDIKQNDKNLNLIEVEYNFEYLASEDEYAEGSTLRSSTGYSKQTLYWDNKKGILDHYNEQFKIQIIDIYNNVYVFTGIASAEITEYKSINNETKIEEIQKTVEKMNLDNISVKKGEKGLTISLDNIQFEPDSNILLDSEKIKLNKIADILNQYSNDLLITGHCAERGTVKARQLLSEQRAESVASYLRNLGVRDEYHIFTQGKGSKEPVATNSTEAGRAKNRRVEITIMD